MKKFQKLDDPLFNDSKLNLNQMRGIYGGDDGLTRLGDAITSNCSTHTAGSGSGHNNDGCDSSADAVYKDDSEG